MKFTKVIRNYKIEVVNNKKMIKNKIKFLYKCSEGGCNR